MNIQLDTIYNEDCLVGMQRIPDGMVDCIICDLPYGTTANKWDVIIPFDRLWEQYERICKPNAAIVLFGQEPFSSMLRLSKKELFRYDWYWKKSKFANYAQAPYMPIKDVEIISVFSKGTIASNSVNKMNYFPQGVRECHIEVKDKPCSKNFRPNRKPQTYTRTHTGYPHQFLSFPNGGKTIHSTQKPIELIRYLVRTYSNEGDVVLDNCIGSGTTAIAAIREKRHFIGFELNKDYFDKAQDRINKIRQNPEFDFNV